MRAALEFAVWCKQNDLREWADIEPTYVAAYIELLRALGQSGFLSTRPMTQSDAYRMIGRRAVEVGIATKIGNHSFRATGITEYLRNGGRKRSRFKWRTTSQPGQLGFMIGGTRFRSMRSRGL